MPAIQLWERQQNEGPEAFEAAHIYIEMGEGRSTYKVADQVGKSIALIQRWSSQHDWVERARAFDNYLLRRDLEELEADRVKARKRHAQVSKGFQARVIERLNALTPQEVASIPLWQLVKIWDIAVKNELLSLGQPTSRSGGDTATALQERLRVIARQKWDEGKIKYPTLTVERRRQLFAEQFGIEPEQFFSWAGIDEREVVAAPAPDEPVM